MLDPDTRRRHLYVVGQISTGKSTLLLNLIAQDLAPGQGLAVLDPHGDLAETVLFRPLLSFEAALRRTRRIPPAAQPGYLMGIRLERYIAEGLRKLGCGGA